MKKIFTLLAAMLLVPWVGWGQNVWDGSAKTDWYDTNPEALEFTINTAEDLAGLAKLVNESPHINFAGKTVKLGADIFLNEEVLNENRELNDGSYKEWKPIGYVNSIAFQGTFDGQGHTISGLYSVVEDIDNEDIDLCGLFGYVGDEDEEPAIIKNVSIIDSYIKGGTKDYVPADKMYPFLSAILMVQLPHKIRLWLEQYLLADMRIIKLSNLVTTKVI